MTTDDSDEFFPFEGIENFPEKFQEIVITHIETILEHLIATDKVEILVNPDGQFTYKITPKGKNYLFNIMEDTNEN